MEHTLVLLKPDALERGLAGAILGRFEAAGLRLTDCCCVQPNLEFLSQHYAELRVNHPDAFERTARYLAGKPFIAVRLTGPHAVRKTRLLVGPTDPLQAPAGTIRGDYGADSIALADAEQRATLNLVHAADSPEAAARELQLWFQFRTCS